MILIVFDICLLLVASFVYYYYHDMLVLTFEKKVKYILITFKKSLYIYDNLT